ncbi:MAG: ADP-ribosyl-[dinitrogen reductase] hydrolase [Desulfuromonadia bacterium]
MSQVNGWVIDPEEILSRAEGAFLGMAVGDALGATVEFLTPSEIRDRYGVHREMVGGGWLRLRPGSVTDDTEMAIAMADALIREGGWSLEAIADAFTSWLKGKPTDCGDTCRRGIRRYLLNGTIEAPPNQWDGGNGGVMRALPAILYAWPDRVLMERCVVQQARITHNHPLSDGGCIVIGRLLFLALAGHEKSRLYRETERLIAAYPPFAFTPYRGMATGYVVDTLQTVLFHFFSGKSFEDCLVRTVNQGGDADTTGAICGMLAGAYYGPVGIPARWLRKMNGSLLEGIRRRARTLLSMAPSSA